MLSIQNIYTRKKGKRRLVLLLFFSTCFAAVHSQNLNNPNKRGPLGTQVNTFSGNLFIPRTDLYVPARGFGLNIRFYYNSFLFTEDQGYGKGWTFEYNIRYKNDTIPGSKLVLWGDGREDTYDSIPGGTYKTPRGFYNTLSQYQPGKYVLTELNGVKYFFDNAVHKRITRMDEPNGNFINFTYTDSLLTAMTNAAGQSISFTYDSQGRLATVVDAIAIPSRTFTYTYDAAGNLKEAKDPLNNKYQYTYLVNGPMKSLADKNNNKIDIIYFPDMTVRELIGCNKRMSFSYDTSSKTTFVTDHLTSGNQVTKYKYQTLDNISWVTSVSGNCCGFNMSYEYDDQGNQLKMTDANGQVYNYTYDEFGNTLTVTDPLNQTSTYTYTADFKKVSSYKDPKGNIYTVSYDSYGNMTQLITPGNNIYTATYNANGDIISSTDPKGNTYTYNYDSRGNPLNVTGPNGYQATLSFDARGNLLSYTDARGNTSLAEYDILSRLKKMTDPINNNIQLTYDAAGNPVTIKNKNNETTILNFDASNRLVNATGPTGNQSSFTYDGMDNLLSAKNALGHETKMNYDTRNRLKSAKDPDNNNATYTYDGNGNIISANLPNGQHLNYIYDALNRLIAVSDATSTIASLVYDKNGNITSYTNATGATTTATYDSLNRIKTMTDPLGNSRLVTYDKNNNIVSVTDREGRNSFYSYDSLNRIKTFTDNNGFIITTDYDAQSNLISLKDQNNNITNYTYDSLNRRKRMTYPDGKYVEYTYDKESNITSIRRTDASVVNYQYDTLNRITSRTLPGGEIYTYTYDKLNRVLTATNNNGTTTFTYDNLNRITSENFDGRTIRYSYSISGRTQTTIYPDSTTVIKEFDTRNRLTKILKDSVTVAEYSYNNANQLTQKTFSNGVSSTMQYDFANRLSNLTTTATSGIIQNSAFSYDKEYHKTAITRNNNLSLSEQFTYDNGYRLINYKRGPVGSPVVQNSYTYDAVGNRTAANLNGVATTYSVNNLNQLTAANSTSFTFDDRGNLTYDGIFYKVYDTDNRLVKDSSSPTSVITYSYDAIGRRITRSINGNLLKYTYSGAAPIEERNSSNVLLNRTVFNSFLSPVMNEKNGNKFYYHPNDLGSVEAISNNNGRLIESYRYDVYGKLSRYDSLNNSLSSSIAGNRFGFTGQEYDSATGSYRFFYRNYSAETGVFNQRDPIGYEDGMGMYQYVGDDPANGIDVWGLKRPCPEDEVTDPDKLRKQNVLVYFVYYSGFRTVVNVVTGNAFLGIKSLPFGFVGNSIEAANFLNGFSQRTASQNFSSGTSLVTGIAGTVGGTKAAIAAWDIAMKSEAALAASGTLEAPALVAATEAAVAASAGGTATTFSTTIITSNGITMAAIPTVVVVAGTVAAGTWVGNKYINQTQASIESEMAFNIENDALEYQRSRGKYFAMRWMETQRMMEEQQAGFGDDCGGGSRRRPRTTGGGDEAKMFILFTCDPNLIKGPDGEPDKAWVSINDRIPYTIYFENDTTATAPVKYLKITSPVEPKQDATTLELGNVGFNSMSFEIPAGNSFYTQRLDARDSTGLYIDLTAGYDIVTNNIFWEFQAIDPITLLPPEDPLAGFLFVQDTLHPEYGKGFVNFTIKPRSDAQTLDTIGARAFILFDQNDTIPTNIHTNTIDAFAPTSSIVDLPNTTPNTDITISYTGTDDPNGSGVKWYSIYVADDNGPPELFVSNFTRTDTIFKGIAEHLYRFYITATDTAGNVELLKFVDSVRITGGEFVICPDGTVNFDARILGANFQWQVDNGTGFTNITNGGIYSGASSSTLILTNAPSNMYGYQFRCLVDNIQFSEVYLLKFGMSWEGTVNNVWENPANWSCNALPDMYTDVTINGSKANYPTINSDVTIRTLRMNAGATGTVNTGFKLTILK